MLVIIYASNLVRLQVTQNEQLHYFHQEVLKCYVREFDFAGQEVDVALRKFQQSFTLRGEAQKIERIIEAFADRSHPNQLPMLHLHFTYFLLQIL